jgi:PhnB protein
VTVKAIPDGFHTVTPYFSVQGVPSLIEFFKRAFDAIEIGRAVHPDGTVLNATVRIGDSSVMLGEIPEGRQPMLAMLYMYVDDADAVYERAMQAGGTSVMKPIDHSYGDRAGAVKDPSGNEWWIATRQETLSDEELVKRASQRERK